MHKDYYVVLGVPRSESPEGIRHAFRELALRYHPDRGGPHATRYFQDIVEAYHVLSDPRQRWSYDQGLEHAELGEAPAPAVWPRVVPPPEPLVPGPLVPQPVSVLHDFDVIEPSWEELRDQLRRNFTAQWLPKSHRLETLTLELTVHPQDAARGGVVAIRVPVYYPCAVCHGSGREWLFTCVACDGEGLVPEEQPVRVYVPAGTQDGATIDVPLRGFGIHNLLLRLLVRVAW